MYSIARLPEDERRILFRNTAQKMGMNEAIIEKDFWVCLTLDYLFSIDVSGKMYSHSKAAPVFLNAMVLSHAFQKTSI